MSNSGELVTADELEDDRMADAEENAEIDEDAGFDADTAMAADVLESNVCPHYPTVLCDVEKKRITNTRL